VSRILERGSEIGVRKAFGATSRNLVGQFLIENLVLTAAGGAVGLAMIDAREPITQAYLDAGKWDVEIGASRHPAIASLRPLYDPENKRIKA